MSAYTNVNLISRQRAFLKLDEIRSELRSEVSAGYEHRAKSCKTCETPGACCLDEHFVNVRISRLEAAAINNVIECLPDEERAAVRSRIARSIVTYDLQGSPDGKYACPLYQKGTGCLVHNEAKPLPCITHACYENKDDLPPLELLAASELRVEDLNRRTYLDNRPILPIPIAISRCR